LSFEMCRHYIQKVINEHDSLTCLISIPLNGTGKTWKMDINGHGKSWKCIGKVLESHGKQLSLFCTHPERYIS